MSSANPGVGRREALKWGLGGLGALFAGPALLAACGVDPAAAFEQAGSDANKALLKAETALAVEIGIIGAPCLVTEDGEVFWGNDRLEQGLDWAAGARAGGVV